MLNKLNIEEKLKLMKSPKVDILTKNYLATILSETKDERVYHTLCELIDDSAYSNKRGTFVHCLRNYPPEKSFELAVELILNGNFEVSHEAFEIINSIESEIEGERVKSSYNKIMYVYRNPESIEDWRLSLIRSALEMFS